MKYYLPIHLNGNNRGCEGITKGTAELLNCCSKDIICLSSDIKLDKSLGLDKYVTLIKRNNITIKEKLINKLIRFLYHIPSVNNDLYYKSIYEKFLKRLSSNDIMLSTGGDMFCYGNNETIYTNDYLFEKKIKTILWGCSIGENNLTPEKISTLRKFTLIYARESLTKEVLNNLGINNVYVFPDPAFILKAETCKLPKDFEDGNTIGLNISNYVLNGFTLNSTFGEQVIDLINYILKSTKYKIMLIPHVMWNGQDDRIVCNNIINYFSDNKRIYTLDTSNYNYLQIRYIISKCRFFIGARTHAVISAYSTCIPTIALGYSIKSIGIAKDLKVDEKLVVNCKDNKSNLLSSFCYLLDNEIDIHEKLKQNIPNYIKQLQNIKNLINNLVSVQKWRIDKNN